MGSTSPVGIGIPAKGEPSGGRLYAGLPLQIDTGLPFSINGQFDVDVARRGLQHESLNKWIIDQAATLTASVGLIDSHRILVRHGESFRSHPTCSVNPNHG